MTRKHRGHIVWFVWLVSFLPCDAQAPTSVNQHDVPILSLEDAVAWSLQNNPELAALRQQQGIAAAGVVIARTYPHNPVYQATVTGVTAPAGTVIANHVPNQHSISWEIEIRGQRGVRKEAAALALTKTEWTIAAQEVQFALSTVRAFDNLLYRRAKLGVTEEFFRLNQQASEQIKKLVDSGTLKPAELILARAEVSDIQTQLGLHRTAIVSMRRELLRALGAVDDGWQFQGQLDRSSPTEEVATLIQLALDRRPDLQARRAATAEAEARVRLQVADRFGNPSIGPTYQMDQDRLQFIGGQIVVPIPVFNRRQGEIQQLQAQLAQTALYEKRTEADIRRDVPIAVARLKEAKAWVETYKSQVLPDLRQNLADMDRLFQQAQGGADVLRVLDVRRKLLRAEDSYLDAQLGYSQALTDIAEAVGDPALAMGNEPAAPKLP